MNKLKAVAFIIIGVILAYIVLIAGMPVIISAVQGSSEIVGNNPNIDLFTGAKEGLDIMPWVLYFLPGVIGIAAIVFVMRREE